MSKQTIQLGTAPTGVGGDTPRSAFTKTQSNFDELYAALGASGSPIALPASLPVAQGGTGGNTQAAARSGLGLGAAAVAAILGTVSHTGGVPTGAIIETGANVNGVFTKYADGTMICSRRITGVTLAFGSPWTMGGTVWYASTTWTFPSAFASAPVVSASVSLSSRIGWASVINSTPTTGSFYVVNNANETVANNEIYTIAVGRWF